MERLRIIREVIGDKDLMVDVNRAWDFRRPMEIIKISSMSTAYVCLFLVAFPYFTYFMDLNDV